MLRLFGVRRRRPSIMMTMRRMTEIRFFSSSSSSNEEEESTGSVERDAMIRRVNDAMKRTQWYPESQQMIREFWQNRRDQSRRKLWSIIDISRSVKARRVPLKVSAIHALYCTGVTTPYVFFTLSTIHPLTYTHTHTHRFMYLHTNGHTESKPDQFVEWVLQNSSALSGITGFLATALFLMLSFRINRGVGRWWEGRSVYGDMLGNLRGLVQASHMYITNKRVSVEIGLWSYAYARAVELDLRKDQEKKFTATFTGLMNAQEMDEMFAHPRRPFYISDRLTMKLNEAFDQGHVRGIRALVAMQDLVEKIIVNSERLHRIRETPEPWSYQKHMRLTAMIWLGILPLSLMPTLQWATPVFSTAIGYVVFKLDDISVELQNPFGFDRSDLSICILNDEFQKSTYHSLLYSLRLENSEFGHGAVVQQNDLDKLNDEKGLENLEKFK